MEPGITTIKIFWLELIIIFFFIAVILLNSFGFYPFTKIIQTIGYYYSDVPTGQTLEIPDRNVTANIAAAVIAIAVCFIGVFTSILGIIDKYKYMSKKDSIFIELKGAVFFNFSALIFAILGTTFYPYYATLLLCFTLLALTELGRIIRIIFKGMEE
jgi:hypothetical protein